MIPYCVFALQRRSYREGEQSFGFFFLQQQARSVFAQGRRKGGGANFGRQGGRRQRQIRLLPPIAPSPASPVKKRFPSFFRKKRGRRIFIVAKSREGRVPKKFNPSSSSSFQHYAARRRCYTRAPLPLLILTTTTSKFKRSTHSRAKVSPTSSSSLLFRLLPIQTFHHPREEGRRMPFSPPPPVKRGPNRLPRRRRKKKAATWGIRMDGPISLMLSPAGGGIYAPSFQLLPPLFSPAPWNRSSPSPLSLQRKVPWGGAGGKKKAAKGGKPK